MGNCAAMTKAKPSFPERQASLCDSLGRQRGFNSQQLLQSRLREAFEGSGSVLDKVWGDLPKQMVDSWYYAEIRQ